YGLVTTVTGNDSALTVEVQKNTTQYTQYSTCDPTGGQNPPVQSGQCITFTLPACGTGTATPTSGAVATSTPSRTSTTGVLPTGTASRTATAGVQPSPTCGVIVPPNFPLPGIVRSPGNYFPTTGKFYVVGGRSSDAAGSDIQTPYYYDPATNAWSQDS